MRKLTFAGFTNQYLRELTETGKTAIYPLVEEAGKNNPRLWEPLFLYALFNGRMKTLLSASRNTSRFAQYLALSREYDPAEMQAALERNDKNLPHSYCKVWNSYQSVMAKPQRDSAVKRLIREKVLEEQREKRISTYRISKALGVNTPNLNNWLKNGAEQTVSLAVARRVLRYLDDFPAEDGEDAGNRKNLTGKT